MKRPRSSITALSLFAIASLSPDRLRLASSASLRATQGPAVDDSNDGVRGGGGDAPPPSAAARLDPGGGVAVKPKEDKPLLTVKLSSSSHPRAASSSLVSSSDKSDAPEIPLVGIGVGNLSHNKVPYILASALSAKKKKKRGNKNRSSLGLDDEELDYRLVDTSHTDSALEVLVGRSMSRLSINDDKTYHVMIKIWHTHLGYERTMLSVEDSLSDILPGFKGNAKSAEGGDSKTDATKKNAHDKKLGSGVGMPDVRIHAILQYPRCYDDLFASPSYLDSPNFPVKYNDCKEEEDALDAAMKKDGGPSPLLDRDNAWKRSYRALEELYHHGTLESIGVSNFGPSDLTQLFDLATVGPHVYQGSLHTLLTQERLVEELVKHGVHYQCYDAASAIVNGREASPRAYLKLERIGAKHGGMMDKEDDTSSVYGYSPVQVVLGWLVHHRGVGVVPGTKSTAHLAENSPKTLGSMPRFSPREALDVETAVLALVKGEDIAADGEKKVGKEGMVEVINANGSSHQQVTDNDNLTNEGEGGVVATIFNTLSQSHRSVRIFHVHPETGEQIQISHSIPPGRSGRIIVNVDDVLIAYDGHGVAVQKFLVESGDEGDGNVDFMVE